MYVVIFKFERELYEMPSRAMEKEHHILMPTDDVWLMNPTWRHTGNGVFSLVGGSVVQNQFSEKQFTTEQKLKCLRDRFGPTSLAKYH